MQTSLFLVLMEVLVAFGAGEGCSRKSFCSLFACPGNQGRSAWHRKSRLEPDQKPDLDQTAVLSESGLCGQLQLNIVYCERVEERDPRGTW